MRSSGNISFTHWVKIRTRKPFITSLTNAPKPYFSIGENDQLILNPIQDLDVAQPTEIALKAWHEAHPPAIRSYSAALLGRYINRLLNSGKLDPDVIAAISELNSLIIRDLVQFAEQQQHPLLIVLFSDLLEDRTNPWREAFLVETLRTYP